MRYTISAGSNSTELGRVGEADTLLAAKRIGRRAMRESLPNCEGWYTVRDESGETVAGEERSIRTNYRWQ